MEKTRVCLGCGAHYDGPDCIPCARKRIDHLRVYGHWPLEVSLSAPALAEIETAVRDHLKVQTVVMRHEHVVELTNLANTIRSYWQHVAAGYVRAPEATRAVAQKQELTPPLDELFL